MDKKTDTYKTIAQPTEGILFKERQSKFYGYAYPIQTEAKVKSIIEAIRKKHHKANHVCFAWQIGLENPTYRVNDDGEPNNTAGMPIYGQLQAYQLTDILLVVARIFGGTKLGVGGLVKAYRTASQITLDASQIIQKTIRQHFELIFQYEQLDVVMRIIKQRNLEVVSQKLAIGCELIISVRKKDAEDIHQLFQGLYGVFVKKHIS